MGKRKIHGQTYYQCDWTGYPMKQPNCYLPTWNNEKLVRKGTYCNWESVLAHAKHLRHANEITDLEHAKVVEHIQHVSGITQLSDQKLEKLHFSNLEHFGGTDSKLLSVDQYMSACSEYDNPVTVVVVTEEGQVMEQTVHPNDGKVDLAIVIDADELANFTALKKLKNVPKDRQLVVHYSKTAERDGCITNNTASQMFKMQLFGDVIIVAQQKFSCYSSERYVDFTMNDYQDMFTKKRRRSHVEATALTTVEYEEVKQKMQSSLHGYEAQVSSLAEDPSTRGDAMPPPLGKELADVARLLEARMPMAIASAA
jgi:hypothetical protein